MADPFPDRNAQIRFAEPRRDAYALQDTGPYNLPNPSIPGSIASYGGRPQDEHKYGDVDEEESVPLNAGGQAFVGGLYPPGGGG
jgi:hypothetical protein